MARPPTTRRPGHQQPPRPRSPSVATPRTATPRGDPLTDRGPNFDDLPQLGQPARRDSWIRPGHTSSLPILLACLWIAAVPAVAQPDVAIRVPVAADIWRTVTPVSRAWVPASTSRVASRSRSAQAPTTKSSSRSPAGPAGAPEPLPQPVAGSLRVDRVPQALLLRFSAGPHVGRVRGRPDPFHRQWGL